MAKENSVSRRKFEKTLDIVRERLMKQLLSGDGFENISSVSNKGLISLLVARQYECMSASDFMDDKVWICKPGYNEANQIYSLFWRPRITKTKNGLYVVDWLERASLRGYEYDYAKHASLGNVRYTERIVFCKNREGNLEKGFEVLWNNNDEGYFYAAGFKNSKVIPVYNETIDSTLALG